MLEQGVKIFDFIWLATYGLLIACCSFIDPVAQLNAEPVQDSKPVCTELEDKFKSKVNGVSFFVGAACGVLFGVIIIKCPSIPFEFLENRRLASVLFGMYVSFWGSGLGYLLGDYMVTSIKKTDSSCCGRIPGDL